PGEDADGDHREHVIEPAQRVLEAVGETMHLADAGMREGGGRHEREGGGDGQAARCYLAHGGSAHGGSPLAASAAGKIIATKSHIGDAARKGVARSGVGCAVGMLAVGMLAASRAAGA